MKVTETQARLVSCLGDYYDLFGLVVNVQSKPTRSETMLGDQEKNKEN